MNVVIMPDATYNADGLVLRPHTFAARTWLYQNTGVKKFCKDADAVPDRLLVVYDIVRMMRDDGLIVH